MRQKILFYLDCIIIVITNVTFVQEVIVIWGLFIHSLFIAVRNSQNQFSANNSEGNLNLPRHEVWLILYFLVICRKSGKKYERTGLQFTICPKLH